LSRAKPAHYPWFDYGRELSQQAAGPFPSKASVAFDNCVSGWSVAKPRGTSRGRKNEQPAIAKRYQQLVAR
jgi:hypothetical protein